MGLSYPFIILSTILLLVVFSNGEETTVNNEYETIVIGMGAAGTVAASTLARAGKRVLALEAQDRIGGRVYTVPFGDGVVEVGAEWIHGTGDSRTYQTAMNNNISILPQDLDTHTFRSDGSVAGAVIEELLNKCFEFAEESSDKVGPLGEFLTKKIMDYMKEKTPDIFQDKNLVAELLALFDLMTDNYEGSNDWNDVNAAAEYESLEGNQHMSWHRNGYKTFFELMLNKYKDGPGLPSLDIKLNTEVIKIECPQKADEKVLVTTKDGTVYKANNVIVTVSLGVLKDRYKTLFSPSLPQEKVRAIEKLQMGVIGKMIFSFPNAWWLSRKYIYAFLWRSEDAKKVSSEDEWLRTIVGVTTPMGSSNTLTVWTSGNGAKQMETLPEDTVKSKALGLLRQFLGANTTIPEPTGFIRTKWFSNEFTRGTYSYASIIAADVPTARSDLAEPLKDAAGKPRVLFAGEASHPKRFSTVHGAADTGNREAMRLLDQYNSVNNGV